MRIFFLYSIAIIVSGGLASISGYAPAASFNCNLAKGCVENVICQSPQLSKLDSEMAEIYYEIKAEFSRNQRDLLKEFVEDQKAWLRDRNACGCNANCLLREYRRRIGDLYSWHEYI